MINNIAHKDKEGKVFVVYNPAAGLAINSYILTIIKSYLNKHSTDYEIYFTSGMDNIREIIKDKLRQGFIKFVAVGGDGTVSLLADGLFETGFPLGIIPTGTGNLIARELNIPLNPHKALQLAFSDTPKTTLIDGMLVNGKRLYFLNVSVGFSAELMHEMQRQEKRLFGKISYVAHFIRLSLNLLLNCIIFNANGRKHVFHATEAILSNGKILGFPTFKWQEPSQLDDGRVSFHVLRALSWRDILWFAISLSPIQVKDKNSIVYFTDIEDSILIDGKQKLKVQADGDFITYTPIDVKIIRRACCIITPSASK